ncbi:MAG TPA: tetratricopeptide repeat protein [Gemmatimonadales bacterium]|nr:tetratricopeptide repeat protein [Gemmatimonadales bacterium]
MRPLALSLVVAFLIGLCPPTLQAQKGKVPKRPDLGAAADTNYAPAYYTYGVSMLERDPQRAAAAFYWAARIDPTWAQPLYARRVALFLADPRLLMGYLNGNRRYVESKEARSIDSLELRALTLDPFLTRNLDKQLIVAYLRALFQEELRQNGEEMDAAHAVRFDYFMEKYLRNDARERVRARMAMAEDRIPEALDLYRKALPQEPDDRAGIHIERARGFYAIGNQDSTRAELSQALDELRKKDQKAFVYVYQSKALLEHCIGLTYETKAQFEPAREAYGRALQEDLSYYPAHVRLGSVALAAGDTAGALSELDLAVQLKGDDPWVRATYGITLAQTNRSAAAVEQLRKAIELEPFYPGPYYILGRVEEVAGKSADAAEGYRGYLAHASSQDARVADAKQRLAAVSGARDHP